MGNSLLLHIGPSFSKFDVFPFEDYSTSYIKYLYQDSEGFDTSVGTFVGFNSAIEAGAGTANPGLFLSTFPGAPSSTQTTVQLPKILRIFPDATSGIFPNGFYTRLLRDLGGMIEAATVGTLHGINIQTGYSQNPDNPSDDPRWLLQAIPNAGDPDTGHVVVGQTFVICCMAESYPFYHSLTDPGPTPTYIDDFARFTDKHKRFQRFGGLIFRYPTGDVAEDAVIDAHVNRAINGTDGYPGALADYGWQYVSGTSTEPSSTFIPYVKSFFNLP